MALITENTATKTTVTIGSVTNSHQGYESRGLLHTHTHTHISSMAAKIFPLHYCVIHSLFYTVKQLITQYGVLFVGTRTLPF
jgi:hypothetical protein